MPDTNKSMGSIDIIPRTLYVVRDVQLISYRNCLTSPHENFKLGHGVLIYHR